MRCYSCAVVVLCLAGTVFSADECASADGAALCAAEAAEGFVPLFDGKSLAGWKG